jgi:hypothetical protein
VILSRVAEKAEKTIVILVLKKNAIFLSKIGENRRK